MQDAARELADMAWEGYDDEEIREAAAEKAPALGMTAQALYRAGESMYRAIYEGDPSVTIIED